MLRFIEELNIAYLERLLATEAISDTSRHLVEEQLLTAQRRLDALFLCAVTPTLLCALHRLRHGLRPLPPRADLGYAGWFALSPAPAFTPLAHALP